MIFQPKVTLITMYFQSINGKEICQISLNDRGLAYGDGIFTTAKVVNGKVELLSQHINRLINGCERLNILNVDFNALKTELINLTKKYDLAVLKVIVTAGEGGRGYSRPSKNQPNIIIKISEFPVKYNQWQSQGITVAKANIGLGINPLLAGLKHLNRLEQVLIKAELDKTTFDDLLVFDIDDHAVETSCANVFWFKDNELFTPKLTRCGVAGILRDQILQKHSKTNIVQAKHTELQNIQAMFITNSIMGIVPVSSYCLTPLNVMQVHQFKHQLANIA